MKALSAAASAVRHASGAAAEALLVAAIVAALALALSPLYGPARTITGADSADAAKGGRAHATLAADPHQVARGQGFQVRGQGYDPDKQTWVKVVTSTSAGYYAAGVAADGSLSLSLELWQPGRANLSAVQVSSSGRSNVMADCWVDVAP